MTGATILGCAGPCLSPDEAAFFRAAQPWGFILFRRNVDSVAQVRALTGAHLLSLIHISEPTRPY